jgi:hypothetical protein
VDFEKQVRITQKVPLAIFNLLVYVALIKKDFCPLSGCCSMSILSAVVTASISSTRTITFLCGHIGSACVCAPPS